MGGKWLHRITEYNPDTGEGVCSSCGSVGVRKKTNSRLVCRIKIRDERKRYREKYPEKIKEYRKNNPKKYEGGPGPHGLTPTQARQFREGKNCQICGGSGEVVDHCHLSGSIRGVLCVKCNLGLGYFNDDSDLLKNAIEYLEIKDE